MKRDRNYIVCGFNSLESLLSFSEQIKSTGFSIDYFASEIPVPQVSGMCKPTKSFISLAGLIAGLSGMLIAFIFQNWVTTSAYPLMTGGKPSFPILSFIPVMFETGVLFAALAVFLTFLIEKKFLSSKISKNANSLKEKYKLTIIINNSYEAVKITEFLSPYHDAVYSIKA